MTRRKHWSLKNESKTFTLLTRRFDRSTTTESFRIFTFSNTRRPQQNKQTNSKGQHVGRNRWRLLLQTAVSHLSVCFLPVMRAHYHRTDSLSADPSCPTYVQVCSGAWRDAPDGHSERPDRRYGWAWSGNCQERDSVRREVSHCPGWRRHRVDRSVLPGSLWCTDTFYINHCSFTVQAFTEYRPTESERVIRFLHSYVIGQ